MKKQKQKNRKNRAGKSAYATMFFRGMWDVKSRLLAIFGIAALGVGFLFGLISTAPDMYETADAYYDDTNMMDIRLLSTLGFTDRDVEAVAAVDGVTQVQAGYTANALLAHGDDTYVTLVHSIPADSPMINSVTLTSGRMPEAPGECLAESGGSILPVSLSLGDRLSFAEENDSDLSVDGFTVVGTVESSRYFSIEQEQSPKGNGKVSLILYTPQESFSAAAYHVLYVRSAEAAAMNCFDEEYRTFCDDLEERILNATGERRAERFDEVRQLLETGIADGRQRLADAQENLATMREQRQSLEETIAALKNAEATPENTARLEAAQSNLRQLVLTISTVDRAVEEGIQTLQTAENTLAELEEPTWYSYDRDSNLGYKSFRENARKIADISRIFPIFFFLVALLVSLTTMTRMVEEERLMIGTMKALGYGNRAITRKYLLYAAMSGTLGIAVGLAMGNFAFPGVIINAYTMVYALPPLKFRFHVWYAVISSVLMLAGILFATYAACRSSLREVPASLMRPKAPKSGKRIFLEKIRPLWRRMKFSHKVTARNLLLYKKRFFMTVIGVAGCTALLLTGFGIRDCVGNVVDKQYGGIFRYNLMAVRYQEDTGSEWEELLRENGIEEWTCAEYLSQKAWDSGESKSVSATAVIPQDDSRLSDFIRLRDAKTGEEYEFTSQSVFITRKMSELLHIGVGDTLTLTGSGEERVSLTVSAVVENYISTYVYIGRDAFREAFGREPVCRVTLARSDATAQERDAVAEHLLADDNTMSASFNENVRESFDRMIGKVNYVVYVLIVSAGALAFIVLYNLININIAERQREIATIKVLGFYDREVNAYVFREIFALTGIGAVFGLLVGVLLHYFVIRTVEMDTLMFEHTIKPLSFLLALALTFLFSVLVSLVMHRKLKKIDMVESLKSAE